MKLLPALLASAFAAAAFAAEVAPQPTTLDCDHAELWSVGAESRGVCTGSVVLIGTNLKITCDKLEFAALGVGDKSGSLPTLDKFQSLLATGHVVIVQGDREAKCGRAEVLPRSDKVILTETPSVVDRGTGWTSAGDIITMLRGERRVIVEKSRVTGPAIKDLGFDKSAPVPPADAPAKPDSPK
jgi:lipopolysaccharide export system protein LptA